MLALKRTMGDETPHPSATNGSGHQFQLFDHAGSLSDAVSMFVGNGLARGDTVLAVLSREHWFGVASRLRDQGLDPDEAASSGQLTIRDAAEVLATFMPGDRPDAKLFDATVGGLVRQLRARGKPLRIYGEMVDLLAGEASFRSARQLEDLWNELGTREPFLLFCGYSSAHFGNPRDAGSLREICHSHTQVRVEPRDLLGAYLISATANGLPRV
jgi:hypothetical protein